MTPDQEREHQIEVTHDVLDLQEGFKRRLDAFLRAHLQDKGDIYALFDDAFGDLLFTICGERDIDDAPLRRARPEIREWDAEVMKHFDKTRPERESWVQRLRDEERRKNEDKDLQR